jgi:hypothetical protein
MAFGVDYEGMGQNQVVTFKQTGLTKDSHEGRLVKLTANAVNLRSSSIDNIMLSFSTMKFSIKNSIFNNWNSMF